MGTMRAAQHRMAEPQLFAISLATLQPTEAMPWDLYILPRDTNQHILYRAGSYPFHESDLQRLADSGVKKLYIPRDDRASYQRYLRQNLDPWLANSGVPATERMETLNQVVSGVLNDSFRKKESEQIVAHTIRFGKQTAAFLAAEPILFDDLVRVLQHDYTTFTHSANVCYYSVLLAKSLGIEGDDLAQFATGALLHDLGKLEIDPRLLTKDNRLSEAETREMQRHPTLGFRRLCRQEDLTEAQLMIVYQHHERLDGTGYPVGLPADEIHPWAKICSVVDVFDALTSDRPYRTALSHEVAIQTLEREANTAFDAEMIACWKQLISTNDGT
jgi:HD-GYP domain-containing protein (c-di-GMP phosphodiesterase class II)